MTIQCNTVHADLFVLMGEALLKIAKESGCQMDAGLLKKIKNFWLGVTETMAA